jgi:hypothetical protein
MLCGAWEFVHDWQQEKKYSNGLLFENAVPPGWYARVVLSVSKRFNTNRAGDLYAGT